jgi:Spy/CpxP family protein refolding chaperone
MNRMLLALMLLGTPALAQAGTRPEARQELTEARVARLAEKLGLDAAGAARLRTTLKKYDGQMAPLRADVRTTRGELDQELAVAKPDDAKVARLTDRLTREREKLHALRARRMGELKGQLTPEQYARLVTARHGWGRRAGRLGAAQR